MSFKLYLNKNKKYFILILFPVKSQPNFDHMTIKCIKNQLIIYENAHITFLRNFGITYYWDSRSDI